MGGAASALSALLLWKPSRMDASQCALVGIMVSFSLWWHKGDAFLRNQCSETRTLCTALPSPKLLASSDLLSASSYVTGSIFTHHLPAKINLRL